ncbi:MAG: HIT family protein [Desulfuromonadales bacterium]|nr:HIT family protein [Desulfuromonadales bacterium]
MFTLHAQLEADTFLVAELSLSRLLLMNDATYPWFILVPRIPDVKEIHDLSTEQQQQLLAESSRLSSLLAQHFQADKMNIAALGNMVPQLHIHYIVRYRNDPAWPKPVWGHAPAAPYSPEQAEKVLAVVRDGLSDLHIS